MALYNGVGLQVSQAGPGGVLGWRRGAKGQGFVCLFIVSLPDVDICRAEVCQCISCSLKPPGNGVLHRLILPPFTKPIPASCLPVHHSACCLPPPCPAQMGHSPAPGGLRAWEVSCYQGVKKKRMKGRAEGKTIQAEW